MESFKKQPWEVLPIAVDFAANMDDGESIALGSSSIAAYVISTGEDATDTIIVTDSLAVSDSTKLTATVQAGTDGTNYKISFRAHVSDTKKLEMDVAMVVSD